MPKGVMLSHDNVTWTVKAQHNRPGYPSAENARVVSYLPLSHVAGLFFDLLAPVVKGQHVHFAESTALQGTLVETLKEVRPHIFFAVPRVWEKIYDKIKQELNAIGGKPETLAELAQKDEREETIH
jgi:long-chain-fatty-acid--CoA ligase ACSBG